MKKILAFVTYLVGFASIFAKEVPCNSQDLFISKMDICMTGDMMV